MTAFVHRDADRQGMGGLFDPRQSCDHPDSDGKEPPRIVAAGRVVGNVGNRWRAAESCLSGTDPVADIGVAINELRCREQQFPASLAILRYA